MSLGLSFKVVGTLLKPRILLNSAHLSILVNGTPKGDFTCKRGVRQGDPLSPLLFFFCIAEEVLSRVGSLSLQMDGMIKPISTPRGRIPVLSCSFADDVFIFCRGDSHSLNNLVAFINSYSEASVFKGIPTRYFLQPIADTEDWSAPQSLSFWFASLYAVGLLPLASFLLMEYNNARAPPLLVLLHRRSPDVSLIRLLRVSIGFSPRYEIEVQEQRLKRKDTVASVANGHKIPYPLVRGARVHLLHWALKGKVSRWTCLAKGFKHSTKKRWETPYQGLDLGCYGFTAIQKEVFATHGTPISYYTPPSKSHLLRASPFSIHRQAVWESREALISSQAIPAYLLFFSYQDFPTRPAHPEMAIPSQNKVLIVSPPRARSASSGQGENEHRIIIIMALFFFLLFVSGPLCMFFFKAYGFHAGASNLFFLLLLISHREQLLLVQGHQMRDLPPTPRNRSSGRLPSTHLSIYKNPSPEESRSSRMSMSWIPGFILVLIHHGIFGIYKNILGEGSKANCLLAGAMSGNVHVRFREKGGGQKWPCCTSLVFNGPASRRFCTINPSGRRLVVGGPAELSEKGSLVCAVRIDPCSAVANALSIPPGETLPGLDMPRILLKERGAFGNADTGGAWLSSARAVRCWVKSRNERNPRA
ncbi:hypothetical protein Pint_29395 [Pistacia integerrima]|uniref:Uncharacterized protein n=1 Tax=Pistacia integerrima TaxID=434235 RepID=A0ACC0X0Q8_9ROSI|nr:hypothetical protein Pint_29395 [Pistacia integerrima]